MVFWSQITSSLKQKKSLDGVFALEKCFGSLQGHSAFMEEDYQSASVFYW